MTERARWTRLDELDASPRGSLRTVKAGAHQLVLARRDDGSVHALDNRCPHEGYPLAQGTLRACVLTCQWHNWKFDVRDGTCVLGGEGVRSFPVRVVDGQVEADLADPEPESLWPGLLTGLGEGLSRHDNGRAIRDAARLLASGYDPRTLLAELARHDALHAEYGTTHVLPLAADCGRFLAEGAGTAALWAIAPVIDLAGDTNRRLPPRPRPAPRAGGDAASLRAAIEAEDAVSAEAMLLGALDAGTTRAEIASWLHGAVADHFLDFGHPLIYLVKCEELLAHVDGRFDRDLFAAQLYGIVLATREDTLPYFRPYSTRLHAIAADLPALAERAVPGRAGDPIGLRDAVLDGSPGEAFAAVHDALVSGVPAAEVARGLVGAGAHRFLRFDVAIERDPSVAENWLWATHRFTFASAVRCAVTRRPGPDALRLLFQAVAFINSGRAMDVAPADPVDAIDDGGLTALLDAIRARETARAVALARGHLARHGADGALRSALIDLLLADPVVRPIVLAHAIKSAVAALEEYDALEGEPDRDVAVLAVIRFLASPIAERRVAHTVRTSLDWVVDGRVPRKLTQ